MSIARCSTCKLDYWKYPHAPIPGYCSIGCQIEAKAKRRRKLLSEAEIPTDILSQWRKHLSQVHGTGDINAWFPGCSMCDYLEGKYNAALGEVA